MGQGLVAAGLRQGQITLKGTAESVNRLCTEALTLCKAGILKAKAAGELLAVARENIKHGAFEAWIESEIDVGLTTARTYIKLHEHWDELQELHGPGNLAMLSISKAAASISQKKKDNHPEETGEAPSNRQSTDDFPSDGESKEECHHGGKCEYEEDADGVFCKKCHVARPAVRPPADETPEGDSEFEGPDPEGPPVETLVERRVRNLERTIERLYGELTNALGEYRQLKPHNSRADAEESLNLSYLDFKAHKRMK